MILILELHAQEWRLGPTLLTLCEHLFVSFAIRMLRKQTNKFIAGIKWKKDLDGDNRKAIVRAEEEQKKVKFIWRWGIGNFLLSGILAYVDGRLCRCIPNPVARRIVSGFLLSFLDKSSNEWTFSFSFSLCIIVSFWCIVLVYQYIVYYTFQCYGDCFQLYIF